MKRIIIFVVCTVFITIACHKNNSDNYYSNQQNYFGESYPFKGVLYDSIHGTTIAGAKVYFTTGPYFSGKDSASAYSDSNGEFIGRTPPLLFQSGYHAQPIPKNQPLYLTCYIDSMAGYFVFTAADLKLNDTLHSNIYLTPVGYVSLTLSDTSMMPSIRLVYSPCIGVYSLNYYAINNGYADTTFLIKAFAHTWIHFSKGYVNGETIDSDYDSVLVVSKDTVIKRVTF